MAREKKREIDRHTYSERRKRETDKQIYRQTDIVREITRSGQT